MKKKILISIMVLTLCVGVGAYLKANAEGWPWGGTEEISDGNPNNGNSGYETGVGWINMSCDSEVAAGQDLMICNGGANDLKSCNGAGAVPSCAPIGVCSNACTVLSGRGINYGVSIPSGDGVVTGYAWSENLGYINFAPAGPFPTVATGDDYAFATQKSGNYLRGWARVADIKTEYEKIPSNSGGWQGWIRMSSDANDPFQYGVDVTKMDGTGNNPTYAWSNELGWIDFGRANVPLPPSVTLSASVTSVILAEGEKLPKPFDLTWSVAGQASTCTASCDAADCGGWTGNKNVAGGTQAVSQTEILVKYTLLCTGPGGSDTESLSMTAGCNNRVCSGTTCPASPGTFIPDDDNSFDGNEDNCEVKCTSDSNCSSSSGGTNWKEVTP